MKIENFKEKLTARCEKEYNAQPKELTPEQLHCAVSGLVMEELSPAWEKSRAAHDKARKASYLSMEFLVGRAVYNNLLCLDLLDTTAEGLKELGADINEFEEIEDAALGNGGLGRLAACFLDSAAALGLPLDGYGIRYKYGLFKQGIKNGFQTETADNWQRQGDPWSIRREQEKVVVHFADGDVNAVPYDYPVIGYGTENVGTLRLWQPTPLIRAGLALCGRPIRCAQLTAHLKAAGLSVGTITMEGNAIRDYERRDSQH